MATEKQLQANRINAKAGGVKTELGKAIASKNALKHGVTSSVLTLPGENENDLQVLREEVWEHFLPQGSLEELLVGRITSLMWRLGRCQRAEDGMLLRRYYTQKETDAHAEAAGHTKIEDRLAELQADLGPKTHILNKAAYERAHEKAMAMKKLQSSSDALPGVSFNAEQEGLLNLSRYEGGIERSLYRTLHELERVQAIRKGLSVSPPVVVSVDGVGETDLSQKGE